LGLPALTRAIKLQNRAARVGFDWPSTTEVLDKLHEEIAELAQLIQAKVFETFGIRIEAEVNII
jgi:ATP diphosphatase